MKTRSDTIHFAQEHPVDEALGCMVPASIALLSILSIIGWITKTMLN